MFQLVSSSIVAMDLIDVNVKINKLNTETASTSLLLNNVSYDIWLP